MGVTKELPRHSGSHGKYDVQIKKRIDNVLKDNGVDVDRVSELSDIQIKNLMDDIEDQALDVMEEWGSTKLN